MGTSPELRVHPLREISAPHPGMRYHACHETDATTRDDRAMYAARVPDPARDDPRDDRNRNRDDARARALLERRRRRRHDALRRVGVCSSTPDRRRHDPEPRDDRDARGETRDDAHLDATHDGQSRAGRETSHRAHPDGAPADVAHDLRRELNRMTASRRAAAAAADAAASQNARGPSASPARIDADRRRRARRAATADAVARYRREVLVRMRIVDDDDDASTLLTAPARQLASRAVRAALRRERAATEGVVTKEGNESDVRCECETSSSSPPTAEKDADTAAARTSPSGRSSAATPPPTADETDDRDGSVGVDSGADTGADTGADSGADTGADSGADTPRTRDSCSSETRAVAAYAEFVAAADADDALAAARAMRARAPEPAFEPLHLERHPRVSSSRVAAARLERAWRALQTPFAARVDAAIKFSTPPWRAMFAEALDAWERAAAAVVARERSVVRLEALVARKREGEDDSPDSDEIEAFAEVEAATRDVARAAHTLRAFDETLRVQGTPYLAEFIA